MAELHPQVARRTACEALARAERTPCEIGSDLGWALDTITELSAMVCNLADRVTTQEDPPCGHMLRGVRKSYCSRCQRAAHGVEALRPALLDIPAEVVRAEQVVSRWFAKNNIREWKLGDSQNRVDGAPSVLLDAPAAMPADLAKRVAAALECGVIWAEKTEAHERMKRALADFNAWSADGVDIPAGDKRG